MREEGNDHSQLYPAYKEAARKIAQMEDGDFLSDQWLYENLREEPGTDAFRFAMLGLGDELLDGYGMGIVRQTQDGETGYRVATDKDKVGILGPRNWRRMLSALRRQRRVLESVKDEEALDENIRASLDRQLRSNAVMILASKAARSPKLEAAMRALKGITSGKLDEEGQKDRPEED